jgi:endonuclease-3
VVRKKVANHRAVAHSVGTLERIHMVRTGVALTGQHRSFGAAYRLLDLEKPSPTVTRSGFRDFIHPTEDRLCTVRELARLQTFPDSHVFEGRRCDTYAKSRYVQQTQHEQLGNAVPPLMAGVVARSIRKQLIQRRDLMELSRARTRFSSVFPLFDELYEDDSLGNKKNPLDELIYIMLSRRAREQQYQAAYDSLRRQFRPWSRILHASVEELRDVLRPLGLANQRSKALRDMLETINADFGDVTLAPLKRMQYSEAYNYLRSLPGVNDKTAKCVMLYSLGLPALPVDTHTLRVSKRLGLVPAGTSPFRAPALLDAIVPRGQRGRYHVLTVLHGRSHCTATKPNCQACPLRNICAPKKGKRAGTV